MHNAHWFLFLWGGLAIVIGAVNAIAPQTAWRASRWQYRNKTAMQPSAAGLVFSRIIGGIFVVVGIVVLVMAFRTS